MFLQRDELRGELNVDVELAGMLSEDAGQTFLSDRTALDLDKFMPDASSISFSFFDWT